jgi:two-component system sensor histidine kinase/response regulator
MKPNGESAASTAAELRQRAKAAARDTPTGRRRVPGALEASRERYFDLFDQAPVGYCTVSAEELILEANLTVATMLGASRGAMVGKPFSRFILGEDGDTFSLLRDRVLATPAAAAASDPSSCELRMMRGDGSYLWVRLIATPAPVEDREAGLRVIVTDITERKAADEALRSGADTYRSLVEHAPIGIFQSRPDGTFIRVNAALATMLGYSSPEEAVRLVTNIAEQHYAEQRTRARSIVAALGKYGYVALENTYRRTDGTLWTGRGYSRIVHDERGEPAFYEGLIEDVTERHHAMAVIDQQLDELRRWQGVMLDREDRVQELKREVNDLAGRLGAPARYPSQDPTSPGDPTGRKPAGPT